MQYRANFLKVGAIASRFVPLKMTESFLGREDVDLKDKLRAELAQILNWGLQGLRRLNKRGKFIQSAPFFAFAFDLSALDLKTSDAIEIEGFLPS